MEQANQHPQPIPSQNANKLSSVETQYTNLPDQILSAWTALEVLSPNSYDKREELAEGDKSRVAQFTQTSLPWERNEAPQQNKRLYYQVVLGSIRMQHAIDHLFAKYMDDRPDKPKVRGNAVLAAVTVDSQGKLVKSPAVGISSFGWGVKRALNDGLKDLSEWAKVEPLLIEYFERFLGVPRNDEEANSPDNRPLVRKKLFNIYEELIGKLGLKELARELGLIDEWLTPPEFAIKSYVSTKNPDPPDPLVINSFFLDDLALARKLFSIDQAPATLRRYLGVDRPQLRGDLLRDNDLLSESVTPSSTPLSRWPGQKRRSLVLLQQTAINLSFRETKAGGIIGINGPPGTGKTTLLRDLIAGVVTQRAEAMAGIENPATAFEPTNQRLNLGYDCFDLYRLNQSLHGFEMIVASSNNRAVENVSAELPGIEAVASDASKLRYFKTLSDALHQTKTWGIIAAVLGKAKNRYIFKETFWWDPDCGLRNYLRAVSGEPVEIEDIDPKTKKRIYRLPRIVEAEEPPTSSYEALERWETARREFIQALDESRKHQKFLEGLYHESRRLPALAQAERDAAEKHDGCVENVRRIESLMESARRKEDEMLRLLQHLDNRMSDHKLRRPPFLERIIQTSRARVWSKKKKALRAERRQAQSRYDAIIEERERIEDQLLQAKFERQEAEIAYQTAASDHQKLKQRLKEVQRKDDFVIIDPDFFSLDRRSQHRITPWFSPKAQRLRDEVFITAIALHRAFINAAAEPLRNNIGALMSVFRKQTLPDPEKQALLPDLWASLFLVVPLVSTTFASVNRMLGKLPPESLGWLLVDEAGQALPQAAVGALLRARRAVVVGDPVQIEPVVNLPDELTSAICRRFEVDPDYFNAPVASVQTLADAASSYLCKFRGQSGYRNVGVPLLVHRRCSEPMFGVSNKIAYAELMVNAKPEGTSSAIRDLLGASRWIHVEGGYEDKWCPEEGHEVLRQLRQIAMSGAELDLYIITPFRIVQNKLRELVVKSKVLDGRVNEKPEEWVKERIGTVHTVQGREAEAVFLVLGAPAPDQSGARDWAGGRPNLLNVAVTRAKEVIYVIGNRHLWRRAGVFQYLDSHPAFAEPLADDAHQGA